MPVAYIVDLSKSAWKTELLEPQWIWRVLPIIPYLLLCHPTAIDLHESYYRPKPASHKHFLNHSGISKCPVLFKPIANTAQVVPISQQQGCLQFHYHRNRNVRLCKKRGLNKKFFYCSSLSYKGCTELGDIEFT